MPHRSRSVLLVGLAAGALLSTGTAAALSPFQRCQAKKIKAVGHYAECRLREEERALKKGDPTDFARCDERLGNDFTKAEQNGGGLCPTEGDVETLRTLSIDYSDDFAAALTGTRVVDNGNGTSTDKQSGLTWEQKVNTGDLGNPHRTGALYTHSATGGSADGTAFTQFLPALNSNCATGGFAGFCDWRLPNAIELLGIVDLTVPGCGGGTPCIDPAFGPVLLSDAYLTTTSASANPVDIDGKFVRFFDGAVVTGDRRLAAAARALRGSQTTKFRSCREDKLKAGSKYVSCRLKAEETAAKKSLPADHTRCNDKLGRDWSSAESHGAGLCPTNGDSATAQALTVTYTDMVALLLSGNRFEDNGDGTVTDKLSGLMWEQKVNATPSNPHNVSNFHTYSATPGQADGTAFTGFLIALNNCGVGSGFAGHCDWRLPSVDELAGILDLSVSGCGAGAPCIDAAFGSTLTSGSYLTASPSTPGNQFDTEGFYVSFFGGAVFSGSRFSPAPVRAVRNTP